MMTYRQLVDYLRTNSAFCRSCANDASDAEAAEALRQVAGKMESAISVLENAQEADVPSAAVGAL